MALCFLVLEDNLLLPFAEPLDIEYPVVVVLALVEVSSKSLRRGDDVEFDCKVGWQFELPTSDLICEFNELDVPGQGSLASLRFVCSFSLGCTSALFCNLVEDNRFGKTSLP